MDPYSLINLTDSANFDFEFNSTESSSFLSLPFNSIQMGCVLSLSLATVIPLSYVGLLYVFDHKGTDRNDPESMRKRFLAAFVNNIISLVITYFALLKDNDNPLEMMGIQRSGTLAALVIPSTLVCILYAGQWLMMHYDGQLKQFFSVREWTRCAQQMFWIRDTVVAPITEEIAFRCCAAALMATCLSRKQTIFIAPLSFSLSHLHHIRNDTNNGYTLGQSLIKRVFQGVYTYAFGAYATYLFLSTGHILSPIVTHAICNNLGLPLFHEIEHYDKRWQRVSLWMTYVAGITVFAITVGPLTQREWYMGL